jgi:hypothetical protein
MPTGGEPLTSTGVPRNLHRLHVNQAGWLSREADRVPNYFIFTWNARPLQPKYSGCLAKPTAPFLCKPRRVFDTPRDGK